MELTALVGLILIQITALGGGLARGRCWYGFINSWIILSFSGSLLFISGQVPTPDKVPNHSVCLIQAALMFSGFTLLKAIGKAVLEDFVNTLPKQYTIGEAGCLSSASHSSLWFLVSHDDCLPCCTSGLLQCERALFLKIDGARVVQYAFSNPNMVGFKGDSPYCVLSHAFVVLNYIINSMLLIAALVVQTLIAILLAKIHHQSGPRPQILVPHLKEYVLLFIRFIITWMVGFISAIFLIIVVVLGKSPPVVMGYYIVLASG
ncbi:hypothetical protein L218DRAFT_1009553 [Marasmius fiardii PR-910]|nr:hypothetical protein L218DRAFT_1009553 [Marasmius fiardii PR-910]